MVEGWIQERIVREKLHSANPAESRRAPSRATFWGRSVRNGPAVLPLLFIALPPGVSSDGPCCLQGSVGCFQRWPHRVGLCWELGLWTPCLSVCLPCPVNLAHSGWIRSPSWANASALRSAGFDSALQNDRAWARQNPGSDPPRSRVLGPGGC